VVEFFDHYKNDLKRRAHTLSGFLRRSPINRFSRHGGLRYFFSTIFCNCELRDTIKT